MEKLVFIFISFIIILAGVSNCTEHQERRTKALEESAQAVQTVEHDSYCLEFLKRPDAAEMVIHALIARSFIDDMSDEEVNSYPSDSLKERISEYQSQWLKYDEIDARGILDCMTINALGLTQYRRTISGPRQ